MKFFSKQSTLLTNKIWETALYPNPSDIHTLKALTSSAGSFVFSFLSSVIIVQLCVFYLYSVVGPPEAYSS